MTADTAGCLHDDGAAIIWFPAGDLEAFAHELGHALNTSGLAALLAARGIRTAHRERLRSEYVASRFARLWLLPEDEVRRYRDLDELAAASGCRADVVRERLRELGLGDAPLDPGFVPPLYHRLQAATHGR
jgi:hypothetical protein